MSALKKLAVAALISLAGILPAAAFTPETGFWWNPNEPGSGYAIEIQDNFMFVAFYVYDADGNPEWYTAGAPLQGNALFDSVMHYTYGGPCIDCAYTAPITLEGEMGPVTINFLTETSGTIQFGGQVKPIERMRLVLGDTLEGMLGEWQAVIDFSSANVNFPFNGDVLIFDNLDRSGATDFVDGCRPDNSVEGFCSTYALQNHDLAATYDPVNDEVVVVVNDSADYWLAYYLKVGTYQFDGVAELYRKDSGNNNIFYPVRGFRTASRTYIETGEGPSSVDNGKAASSTGQKSLHGLGDLFAQPPAVRSLASLDKAERLKRQRSQTIARSLVARLATTSR